MPSRVSTSATTAVSSGAEASLPGSPTSASSRGQRVALRRDDTGVHYLAREELAPFAAPPEERFVVDVLKRLESGADWSEQFGAIDDARRLSRFAPRLLVGCGQVKRLVSVIVGLVESLRSALAKNALRCAGELFASLGRKMDSEIELCVPAILRRAADTNAFIAEEAEAALREVCRTASEVRLLTQLLAGAAHRRAEIRARATWCLAMLAQRQLRGRSNGKGADLRPITEAAVKAIADASADVRQSGRFIASVLVGGGALEEGTAKAKLQASVFQGTDPASFDAFDPDAIRRAAPPTASAAGVPGGRVRTAGSDSAGAASGGGGGTRWGPSGGKAAAHSQYRSI